MLIISYAEKNNSITENPASRMSHPVVIQWSSSSKDEHACTQQNKFFSPAVHTARWAYMHRFPSVCLSVCLSSLDQNSDLIIIHISKSIVPTQCGFLGSVDNSMKQWCQSLFHSKAGGLTLTSSCIFYICHGFSISHFLSLANPLRN